MTNRRRFPEPWSAHGDRFMFRTRCFPARRMSKRRRTEYKKMSVKTNIQNSDGLVWLSPEVARFKPNCFRGMTGNAGQIGDKWRENGQKPVFWPAQLSQNASAGSRRFGETWSPNLIDFFDTRGDILDKGKAGRLRCEGHAGHLRPRDGKYSLCARRRHAV